MGHDQRLGFSTPWRLSRPFTVEDAAVPTLDIEENTVTIPAVGVRTRFVVEVKRTAFSTPSTLTKVATTLANEPILPVRFKF